MTDTTPTPDPVFHAIHLRREGSHAIVSIEVDGKWVDVIKENASAPYSHIVEPDGIAAAVVRSKEAR